MKCWAQEWTESESGWGCRPDGYTLHLRKEDIGLFLQAIRDEEAKQGYGPGNPPHEYSYPGGRPTLVEITDEKVLTALKASACGIWGPGRHPPEAIAVAESPAQPPSPEVQLLHQLRRLEEEVLEVLLQRDPEPPADPPIPALRGDDHS